MVCVKELNMVETTPYDVKSHYHRTIKRRLHEGRKHHGQIIYDTYDDNMVTTQ